jgi:crotonobetainyl-CoA:carnitine CoA-transferase CaiB-like acyl-CoA transferase
VRREAELTAMFAPVIATRTTAEWDEVMGAAGVPAAPVRERDELFDDEQAWAQGLLQRIDDDELGPMIMTAPVVRLSDTPGAIRFTGRHLGADTREVLRELGRSDVEIDDLHAEGAAISLDRAIDRG